MIPKLHTIAQKDITNVEEMVLPGILDLRWNGAVLEKLVTVIRTSWAGSRRLNEEAQEWRPVGTVQPPRKAAAEG